MTKSFTVSLRGRISNFHLPKNQPLIPLFEAIVNSFNSIEERKNEDSNYDNPYVRIEIVRESQIALLEAKEITPVKSFVVKDNGIGFNDQNIVSFMESDSTYKASIGGKGVGRFSWLCAFEAAAIESIYRENGGFIKRSFVFSEEEDTINDILCDFPKAEDNLTVVKLLNYRGDYQKFVPKQAETIATKILQHCLVYFVDPQCPRVELIDDGERILLNDLFEKKIKTEENSIEFCIGEVPFSLLNVKIEDKTFTGNQLFLCANNRLVVSKDLESRIIDLDGQIFEETGFWYVGLLSSSYLDGNVDMNRLSFTIPETGQDEFGSNNISMEQIVKQSCNIIEHYLEEPLSIIKKEKLERITNYIEKEALQFRHLLKYKGKDISFIKPNLSEDKLDEELHKIKRTFDKEIKIENETLLLNIKNGTFSYENYESLFNEQMQKIVDANGAALAEYVAHRKVVIDLFEQGINCKTDGKFNAEAYMHDLIYPTKTTSEDTQYQNHNLWIIDEKLSYCSYISSDIPFDNTPKEKRTDILFLDHPVAISEDKNDGKQFDTIILFELKRPMRNDYTDGDNPITQLINYAIKIRQGNAKDKNHRNIKVGENTKFFLYAVCDVTPSLEKIIDQQGFTPTIDQLGFYKYNDRINAYIEVLPYEKIAIDAKKRNRILFEKLGI